MAAKRKGLVVWEVLVGAGVVTAAVGLLMVAGNKQRRATGLGQSEANLRQYSVSHAGYGNDNAGRVAAFSWRATDTALSSYPDLVGPYPDDLVAAASQAVDILRRRGNGTINTMPRISAWIPQILYSHLVLVDYLAAPSPSPWTVSPGDGARLAWRKTNMGPTGLGAEGYRWIHSSSYEFAPAFWEPDFGTSSGTMPYITQSSSHNTFQTVGNLTGVLGKRKYDEVVYPSSKVMMYETAQRYFGPRDAYVLYTEARVPSLLADGSVAVRRSEESNRGANPLSPQQLSSFSITYTPSTLLGEPPALYSPSGDAVFGRFRWTRYGLRGRDFDGPETTTPP